MFHDGNGVFSVMCSVRSEETKNMWQKPEHFLPSVCCVCVKLQTGGLKYVTPEIDWLHWILIMGPTVKSVNTYALKTFGILLGKEF